MRKSLFTLLLTSIFFCSCSDKNLTTNGYKINRYNTPSGEKPAAGDIAYIHIYAYSDGKLETSTRQNDRIMPVRVHSEKELQAMKENGKTNPVYEAVSMMSVGDSISIEIPITEEVKQNPQTANVQEMHYDIVMLEVKSPEEVKADRK